MYVFNIDALKQQLREQQFNQAHALFYLLGLTLLWYLPIGWIGNGDNGWDYASFWASLAIIIGGTVIAYRANGGAQGTQFLERFLALSWVVFWRVIPVFFILGLVVVILRTIAYGEGHYQLTVFGFVFSVVAEVFYYQRIYSHMKHLNSQQSHGYYAHA
ncbi:MAG: hypothetical protein CMF12_08020 [Idiomarina sp.]|uniref:Uncharacterized protein n=1 Tax=Idiomarina aquatica TaxID=1327752 RepID=A0A4R6P297_9GAMM|nr:MULTISPECIES: hypothetical protein [Idiomarina]MAK70641.1 hypothetical protein [Idiomarinaceae bacterium]MBT42456.1 hypothetical protein [Idiomarina sp.]TDP31637.1 hypothetical protein DEU29_11238 [Idiomarina aquatica]HAD47317.1 hypothetical protein [Idiomarina sp.]